jgi:UV DNA damage endonuclease
MLKNAGKERLLTLVDHNLGALEKLIDYNTSVKIALFRVSSDLIPFGSSVAAELPWEHIFAEKLSVIKNKIITAGIRVSMHPGQYTVLNSPDRSVAERAEKDLEYHARVLGSMGLGAEHKIVLHLGGVYGDKKQAKNRFISRFKELNDAVRMRLVLENDDVSFHIMDVLETASAVGIPAVYDNLHNAVNPADSHTADAVWVRRCAATWKNSDGKQKIHYSQQHSGKKPGAHSVSISIDPFLEYNKLLDGMDPDIMLEVKDKNISALKCANCISDRGIRILYDEWARYKYSVLERSPDIYNRIGQMLCDKNAYPALDMYRAIEEALRMPAETMNAVNAAQHVWDHFKDKASESENKRFQNLLCGFVLGKVNLRSVKNSLLLSAGKYKEDCLRNGYYFYL